MTELPQWVIGNNSGRIVQNCPREVRPNSQTVSTQPVLDGSFLALAIIDLEVTDFLQINKQ